MIKKLLALITLLAFLQQANANLCVSFLNGDSSRVASNSVFEHPYEGDVVEFEGFTFKTEKGYGPDLELSRDFHYNGEYVFRVIIYDANQKKVGKLAGTCPAKRDGSPGDTAHFDLGLPKELRDKGIATAFITKFLSLYPNVTTIDDLLIHDNYSIFYRAKRRDLSNTEAFGTTPYGKILLQLGFEPTSIKPNYKEKEVDVIVQKIKH